MTLTEQKIKEFVRILKDDSEQEDMTDEEFNKKWVEIANKE